MLDGVVFEDISGTPEAEAAAERLAAWDRGRAAYLATLPIPRVTYGLWVVLARGSQREHLVATVGEVVGMVTPFWEDTEERWVSVWTLCGRPGPFESAGWPVSERQRCGACLRGGRGYVHAWDGFDGEATREG